jgi:hypothetical protein
MKFSKLFLCAGVLTLAICGVARSGDDGGDDETGPFYGPCVPMAAAWPNPIFCEPSCAFVCWDRFVEVRCTPGVCTDRTDEICKRTTNVQPSHKYRDCDCPFGGGLCVDAGIHDSGSQAVPDCS